MSFWKYSNMQGFSRCFLLLYRAIIYTVENSFWDNGFRENREQIGSNNKPSRMFSDFQHFVEIMNKCLTWCNALQHNDLDFRLFWGFFFFFFNSDVHSVTGRVSFKALRVINCMAGTHANFTSRPRLTRPCTFPLRTFGGRGVPPHEVACI